MNGLPLYIYYASLLSIVPDIILVYPVLKRTKFRNRFLNCCALLFLLTGTTDLISFLLAKAGTSNIIVGNVFITINFLLLSVLFLELIPRYKWFIYGTGLSFLLFVIINSIFIQGIWQFQSYSVALASLILVTYCFIYNVGANTHTIERQYLEYRAGIVAGIFFYFSFSFVVFIFSTYAFKSMSPESAIILWGFHNAFNVIKNFFFADAMYRAGKIYTKKGIRLV